MKKSRKLIPLIYVSSLLLCFALQSCGDEESITGSYQQVESGYKNCGPGVFYDQIEVLSDQGICWRRSSFSECRNETLTLTPELMFTRISTGIKYYDDGSQEDVLKFESNGTYSHEGDFINLYVETRFGTDTTALRIDLDGTLNLVNETLINCEHHGVFKLQGE